MADGLGRGIKAWDLGSICVEETKERFGFAAGGWILGSIGVSVPSWLGVVFVFRSWGMMVFIGKSRTFFGGVGCPVGRSSLGSSVRSAGMT